MKTFAGGTKKLAIGNILKTFVGGTKKLAIGEYFEDLLPEE